VHHRRLEADRVHGGLERIHLEALRMGAPSSNYSNTKRSSCGLQRQTKPLPSSRTSYRSHQSSQLLVKARSYCSTSLRLLTWSVPPSSSSGRKTATPIESSASLLCQRGPIRVQGNLPASTEASIRSAHHLAEATTLLPEVLDLRRRRLPTR
jgi:hypothetical protein